MPDTPCSNFGFMKKGDYPLLTNPQNPVYAIIMDQKGNRTGIAPSRQTLLALRQSAASHTLPAPSCNVSRISHRLFLLQHPPRILCPNSHLRICNQFLLISVRMMPSFSSGFLGCFSSIIGEEYYY